MSVTKVVLAKLSPTMEEGTIVKWSKNEGDPVKVGDVLAEIETDKANMEMEALGSGILRKILVPAGGKAPVGTLIGVIAEAGEDISAMLATAAPAAAAPPPAPAPSRPLLRPCRGPRVRHRLAARRATAPHPRRPAPVRRRPVAAHPRLLRRRGTGAPGARRHRRRRQPASRPARWPGPWPRARTSRWTRSRAADRAAGSSSGTSRPIGPAGRAGARPPPRRPVPPGWSRPRRRPPGRPRPLHDRRASVPVAATAGQLIPLSNMRKTIARRLSESMFTAPTST